MDALKLNRSLTQLHCELIACRACPRLVEWREHVAHDKRRAFKVDTYWGKPVPGFGDLNAHIILVGLAPSAHGGNRTGRLFTGDGSSDFLFSALYRAGFANTPKSISHDDNLKLNDMFILSPVRCVPPNNKPSSDELKQCIQWFDRELECLPNARVFITLGAIAWQSTLHYWSRIKLKLPALKPKFAHSAIFQIDSYTMIGSYHVSQQNTRTGKLTTTMFDSILEQARRRS